MRPATPKTLYASSGLVNDARGFCAKLEAQMRGLRRPSIALAVGAAVFALFAWQAITTAGRAGPLDAGEYLINAEYIDAHGWIPPDYVSYEYSAPPLFEFLAVGAEHAVRALPSLPLELPWNLAARLLWLALVVASVACLTAGRPARQAPRCRRPRARGALGARRGDRSSGRPRAGRQDS